MLGNLGRTLIGLGLLLVVVGAVVLLAERAHLPFGRLPGDFVYRGRHTTVFFPLATMVILSLVLTLVLNLIARR